MDQNKAKTYFWILLNVLIVVAVLNVVFFVMPLLGRLAGSFVSARTITVAAEGKTTVTPDLAESSFSVLSTGKNPQDLADSNNQKITAVITFLKSEGLTDKDIATTGYNLSPNYQYDSNTQRNFITGYSLTQTVTVKMRDFVKVPEIIAGLTPLGVNEIGGINFTVEDPEKYLSIARADAFQKARTKAAEMTSENGASLGDIVNIAESQGSVPVPYYSYGAASMKGAPAPQAIAPPTIEPGTQEVSDDVTLTFELR